MVFDQELGFADLRRIQNLNFPSCLFMKRQFARAAENPETRKSLFYSACSFGTVNQVQYIINCAIDLNDSIGNNTLGFLSVLGIMTSEYNSSNRLKKIDLIAQNNFDFTGTTIDGSTLAHFAANKNLVDCSKYLRKIGCDPHKRNNRNQTALGWIIYDNLALAKIFLDNSTDLSAKGLYGNTIMSHHRNNPSIFKAIARLQ